MLRLQFEFDELRRKERKEKTFECDLDNALFLHICAMRFLLIISDGFRWKLEHACVCECDELDMCITCTFNFIIYASSCSKWKAMKKRIVRHTSCASIARFLLLRRHKTSSRSPCCFFSVPSSRSLLALPTNKETVKIFSRLESRTNRNVATTARRNGILNGSFRELARAWFNQCSSIPKFHLVQYSGDHFKSLICIHYSDEPS